MGSPVRLEASYDPETTSLAEPGEESPHLFVVFLNLESDILGRDRRDVQFVICSPPEDGAVGLLERDEDSDERVERSIWGVLLTDTGGGHEAIVCHRDEACPRAFRMF